MGKPVELSDHTWSSRRIGYLIAIAVMIAVLYVLLHLYEWNVPFLTEDYNDLLWYIRLSIYASIAAHAIFLMYDPKWFRHLLKAAANVFSALSAIMFYVIFPFDFHTEQLNKIVKIVLLIIVILSLISILTEIFKAIRSMGKEKSSQ
jgi:O-antigen/teichoic acid export membrane protein